MDSAINASSSSLVQEITASLTNQPIPEKFIHKNGYPPAEEAIAEDLLIDFSRLSDKDELGKLRSALSAFGCFQVVNHGIDTELLEKVLEVSQQFFALPLEEKMKCYGAAGLFNGYGIDGVLRGNQTKNWNDRLYLRVGSKDPADLEFWPENPPEFSFSTMTQNNEILIVTTSNETPLVTVVTTSDVITGIPSASTPIVCFGSGLPPVPVQTQLATQQVVLPIHAPPQVLYAPAVWTIVGQGHCRN